MAQPLRAPTQGWSAPQSQLTTAAFGRSVIQREAESLLRIAHDLDEHSFERAVSLLHACRGNVIVSGMGKAGLIGQKIAATMASTGTPSHFLHPAEAIHGDLGRVQTGDIALMLSHSGETEEVVKLLPSLAFSRVPVLAITGRPTSKLAQGAAIVLSLGNLEEADPLGLAPTTSTTAMLALGDALAVAVSRRKSFRPEDFARYHPGGSLGRKLARVEEVMRPLRTCRLARQNQTVRDVFVSQGKPGRRSGAILVRNHDDRLVGIFTDSDLARLLETQRDAQLDQPISTVMTSGPVTVRHGTSLAVAIRELQTRKISELPIVDEQGRPIGLIDITDVVAGAQDDVDADRSSAESPVDSPSIQGTSCSPNAGSSNDSKPRIISLPNRNEVDS